MTNYSMCFGSKDNKYSGVCYSETMPKDFDLQDCYIELERLKQTINFLNDENKKIKKQTLTLSSKEIKEYNTIKKEINSEDYMSVVGVFKCSDGVITFGDTKGTILNKYHDVKRGKIRKVFQNKNIIITTYGNNLVQNEKIEDIISRELKGDVPNEIERIRDYISKKSTLEYNFICYDKEMDKVIKYKIVGGQLVYEVCENECLVCGANEYVSFFQTLINHHFNYKKDDEGNVVLLTVKEMRKKIDSNLSFFIKSLDDSLEYNPVGLPLIIDEYYFRDNI